MVVEGWGWSLAYAAGWDLCPERFFSFFAGTVKVYQRLFR